MLTVSELENRIINADCLDILRQLPDKCIDLILTDPPYFGIVKNDWDNQWKNISEFQKWIGEIGREFYRVLKDNGSFYWFGDDKNIAYCQVELDKYFKLLNSLVWSKPSTLQIKGYTCVRSYMSMTERILFYDKGEDKSGLQMIFSNPDLFASIKAYMRGEKEKVKQAKGFKTEKEFNEYINKITQTNCVVSRHYFADSQYFFPTPGMYAKLQTTGFFRREYEDLRREYEDLRRVWNPDFNARDVLFFNTIAQTKEQKIHITQKPLSLVSYLLERSSAAGNLILDCFSGSGTTAVACRTLNRRFICIEKDPDYYRASVERLNSVKAQMRLF
jgi:site-specific DNA-methyltransferase (adenine-specific)